MTIAASDEAYGVFQFSADSLAVNGTEPEEGRSTVVLQVRSLYNIHSTMQQTTQLLYTAPVSVQIIILPHV